MTAPLAAIDTDSALRRDLDLCVLDVAKLQAWERLLFVGCGDGWIAEEALATALLCALRHADDPVGGLARAATTAGDSDSIACLTGAFLGAAYGMSAWPAAWAGRVEFTDQLDHLGRVWDRP